MKNHYDLLSAAHDKQISYQSEVDQDRQAREAQNSQEHKSIKQQFGEQLIQLGYRLTEAEKKAI